MKTKSKKSEEVKKRIGKKLNKRKAPDNILPFIFVDIETAYSAGNKPFIGQIAILNEQSEVLFEGYFEEPREITPEQANQILNLLYSNYSVWCDPTLDIRVIKSDVRRCGFKLKTSKIHTIDIQLIENQIIGKQLPHRLSLLKLARKYRILPPIRFHDSFSDATVIKNIFNQQLKELNIDKKHIYLLNQF